MRSRILYAIVLIAWLAGCTERAQRGSVLSTRTSGSIKIAADESLRPIVEAEVAAFEGLYKHAHFEVIYTSEEQAIDSLLKDSVTMVIVSRRLIPEEQKVLDNLKIRGHQSKFATSGVALVVNRQNPDTVMLVEDLRKILTGEIKPWKDLSNTSPPLGMEVVFDQPTSGIIRYLKDSVFSLSSLPPNCFALKSNQAVVEYVAQKREALGVIDLSWISDSDDSTANSFVSSVKVVGLSISPDSGYYQPYQAYIAQRKYPLRRDIVMISREYYT